MAETKGCSRHERNLKHNPHFYWVKWKRYYCPGIR